MKLSRTAFLVIFLAQLFGCVMQRNLDLGSSHDDVPTAESEALLLQAESCYERAEDKKTLHECRAIYELVIKTNPGSYRALTQLSTVNTLIGTAYTNHSREKSELFDISMEYAERAMLTNHEFRRKIQRGIPLWEAVEVLGEAEVEAMFFWTKALQYDFKEGMSLPSKIINISWLEKALVLLNRIEEVSPDFGGGAVEFAKAICYHVLPTRYGGSDQKFEELMQTAVDENKDWLLPRWARAKYYYEIKNEPEKRLEELRWIAEQDPDNFLDPYPWRMHFIANSNELSSK